VNQWAPSHYHTLAAGQPILGLDMYEHPYHVDFGAKAAAMSTCSWAPYFGQMPTSCSLNSFDHVTRHRPPLPQGYVAAHKWFNVAAVRAKYAETRNDVMKRRDDLARKMTPRRIAEAQKLVLEWKPSK
jgi:hypothetical protein